MFRTIGMLLEILQVGAGFLTVVASISLVRRKVDPAIKVLLWFGAWILLTGVWGVAVRVAYYSRLTPPVPDWVNAISTVSGLAGPIILYTVVIYAVWRFWRAGRVEGGRP